jgi:hypothetical protein
MIGFMMSNSSVIILAQLLSGQIIATAVSPEQWNGIIVLAGEHRVLPMLWVALGDDLSALPETEATRFKQVIGATRIEGFVRKSVIQEVHNTFVKHEIDCVWLKGAVLAFQLYPEFWMRYMRDIDVWVSKQQADQAVDILLARGFSIVEQERPIHFDMYTTKIHHIVSKRGVEVEIHFRLTPPVENYYLTDKQHKWFWNTAITTENEIGNIRTLSLEAQIIHLVHHDIAHHEWNKAPEERGVRLQRKLDLHRLIQQQSPDWKIIIDKAQQLGLSNVLNYAIKGNVELFGVETYRAYPPHLYDNLKPYIVEDYTNEYAERFIRLLKNVSWSAKVKLIFRAIFPTPTEMRLLYDVKSTPALCLRYIIHPFSRVSELLTMIRNRILM